MQNDEVKVGQEIFIKKRTNWHRYTIVTIYQQPEVYRLRNYITNQETLVSRKDFKTELLDEPIVRQKRIKKKLEPDLFL